MLTRVFFFSLVLSLGSCSLLGRILRPLARLNDDNTTETCPDPDITFHLFRKNQERMEMSPDTNLTILNLDLSLPTKIIVHGFDTDMDVPALQILRREYLASSRSMNLISVNWPKLAKGPNYLAAVGKANHVGQCVAQFIQGLIDLGAKDLHLIGFSLGAQVVSYVSNHLEPYKLPRITGLDPAKPMFTSSNQDKKLDKTDAQFVDVYHTAAFIKGQSASNGHVDFYFNGGVKQPGCGIEDVTSLMGCSHNRAPKYFAETVNSKEGLWGRKCDELWKVFVNECPEDGAKELAGEYVNKNLTGYYVVETRKEKPYAMELEESKTSNR